MSNIAGLPPINSVGAMQGNPDEGLNGSSNPAPFSALGPWGNVEWLNASNLPSWDEISGHCATGLDSAKQGVAVGLGLGLVYAIGKTLAAITSILVMPVLLIGGAGCILKLAHYYDERIFEKFGQYGRELMDAFIEG